MKRIQLVGIAILLLASCVMAQPRFQGGLNFTLGFPQSEFKENMDNTGYGGTLHFGYNFPQSPFIVGMQMGFLVYGSETREEPFSSTIPDVFVDVTTTNSIFNGHLLLRVQPQTGVVRPYLDGLFGFNYLSTTTEVKNQNNWGDEEEVASSTNQDDGTMSYGGGGGLMFRVYEGETSEGKLFDVMVDLGVKYLVGGEAEYLKEGSITRKDGKVYYDLSKSTTDLMTYHIGVAINF